MSFLDPSLRRSIAGSVVALALLAAGLSYFFMLSIKTLPVHLEPVGPFYAHARTTSVRVYAPPLSIVELRLNGRTVAAGRVAPGENLVTFGPIDIDEMRTLRFDASASLWYAAIVSRTNTSAVALNPPPLAIPLLMNPPRLNGAIVTLSGRAPPNVDVVLWDARDVLDRVYSDAHGRFWAEEMLDPGFHRVSAMLPRCTDLACFARLRLPLWVDVGQLPATRNARGRSLTLALRYQELRATLVVTVPRSDPSAQALLRDERSLPAFVAHNLPLTIAGTAAGVAGDKRLDTLFSNARPEIRVDDEAITVTADSGYQRPGLSVLPTWSGSLWLKPEARASEPAQPRWWRDRLQISVADYNASEPGPRPLRTFASSFDWEHPYDPDGVPVRITLHYAPTSSIEALQRGMQSSPFAFAPHYIARFLAFTHGFYYALPMFAYLVLGRGRGRLAPAARVLIAAAVASDVWLACVSAQPDVNVELPEIFPWLNNVRAHKILTQLLSPTACGLGLAAIAATVRLASTALSRNLRIVIREAAGGIVWGSLAFAALALCQWLVSPFQTLPQLYVATVVALLTAATVAVLWRTGLFNIALTARSRSLLFACTTVVVLAFAVPTTVSQYALWTRDAATLDVTLFSSSVGLAPLVTDYLRSVPALCPALFGVLLILSVRPGGGDLGVTTARLGQILFACYAVDISGVIVVIPIAFLLSWPTFRWIVSQRATWSEPWTAGHAMLPIGLAFAAAHATIVLALGAREITEFHPAFSALGILGIVAGPAAALAVGGFAFGACFDAIRGRSGPQKARTVACWVALCSLPSWLLRGDAMTTLIVLALELVIFYTILSAVLARQARFSQPATQARQQ